MLTLLYFRLLAVLQYTRTVLCIMYNEHIIALQQQQDPSTIWIYAALAQTVRHTVKLILQHIVHYIFLKTNFIVFWLFKSLRGLSEYEIRTLIFIERIYNNLQNLRQNSDKILLRFP